MNSSQIGSLSSLLALLFAVFYSLAQIATLLQLIPTPLDLIVMFIPSLLLAPCFVVTMAALYHRSSKHSRLLALIGLCFSLLYCGFACLVSFGQLAAILPLQLKHETVSPLLRFEGASLMVAFDCLGYAFMSLAAVCAAFAHAERKWFYRSMLAHGLLAPVIVAAFFYPPLLPAGALWMITFPWAMVQSIRLFNSRMRVNAGEKTAALAH